MSFSFQIESHEDDSVTLTMGALTATIRGETYRDAYDAARTLASVLSARVDLARLMARTTGLRQAFTEVEQALDALDRAVVVAHGRAASIGSKPEEFR
jgi:hypothetical protein